MIALIYKLIICHFIGDYVLQNDFLAKTKGSNLWHMIAHCFLYSCPFAIVFGIGPELIFILVTHFMTDMCKAKYHCIGYAADQILHMLAMVLYVITGTLEM